MPIIHTEAVTLRRRRLREADVIVTLLTKESGKVSATIRSALKSNSRFAGITQPFNRIHAVLYSKVEEQEVVTLTQAALVRQYLPAQENILKIAFFSSLAEWVDALCAESVSSAKVWNVLTGAYESWSEREPQVVELFYYQFQLLFEAGILPELSACAVCGKTDSPRWRYLPEKGGVACAGCSQTGNTISAGSVQAARKLIQSHALPPLKLSDQQKTEIGALIQQHTEFHADVSPNSSRFMQQINNILSPSTPSKPIEGSRTA